MRFPKHALAAIWVTRTPLNMRGRTNEFRFQWAEKRPLLARPSVRYMHTECIFYAGLKHLSLPFQLGSLDKGGGALFPMHLVESEGQPSTGVSSKVAS